VDLSLGQDALGEPVCVCQTCARNVKHELSEQHRPCEYRGTAYLGTTFRG